MGSETWPTLGNFAFDLSERLNHAAKGSLAELEKELSEGDAWVEQYIGMVTRQASLVTALKTPSRTATAKRTRALATATKQRAEQIRVYNEQLSQSPLAAKSSPQVRQPFSPLRVQSLNTGAGSPTPRASPLGRPLPKLHEPKHTPPVKSQRGAKKHHSDGAAKENEVAAATLSRPREGLGGVELRDASPSPQTTAKPTKPPSRSHTAPSASPAPPKDAATSVFAADVPTPPPPTRTIFTPSPARIAPPSPSLMMASPSPTPARVSPSPSPEPPAPQKADASPSPRKRISQSSVISLLAEAVSSTAKASVLSSPRVSMIPLVTLSQSKQPSDTEKHTSPIPEDHVSSAEEGPSSGADVASEDEAPAPLRDEPEDTLMSDNEESQPMKEPGPELSLESESEAELGIQADPHSSTNLSVQKVDVMDVDQGLDTEKAVAIPVEHCPLPVQVTVVLSDASVPDDAAPAEPATSSVAEAPLAEPAVPTRQVRSSWLSQALGTRTVPISGLPSSTSEAPFHRSYAQQSISRSQGSLKRKSGDLPDHEDEVSDAIREGRKADKIARFQSPSRNIAPPRSPIQRTVFSAKAPASAPLPASKISKPELVARQSANSISDKRTVPDESGAALETAAVAAVTKQQTTQTLPSKPVQNTGSSFLHGISGFFGFKSTVETEEDRQRREAEERREREEAEANFARLLSVATAKTAPRLASFQAPSASPIVVSSATTATTAVAAPAVAPAANAAVSAPDVEAAEDDGPEGDIAIVVDDEDEDADDESDDSVDLPELPPMIQPHAGSELRSTPDYEESALGAAGIDFHMQSTTPLRTPPRSLLPVRSPNRAPPRIPEIIVSPPPKTSLPLKSASPVRTKFTKPSPPSTHTKSSKPSSPRSQSYQDESDTKGKRTLRSATTATRTTRSQTNILNNAERVAAIAHGVKPAVAPIKSIQRAAAAAKKEQQTVERKAQSQRTIAQKKRNEQKRKEEEERVKAEEERKQRLAEEEEQRRRRAENERRRKEREERQKAREEAARAKAEEEAAREAAREAAAREAAAKKRKAPTPLKATASSLAKSTASTIAKTASSTATSTTTSTIAKTITVTSSIKRIAPGGHALLTKGKEPARPLAKQGPTAFRTASTANESYMQQTSSTIKLVGQPSRPIGPPSRGSQSTASSSRLQQSRMTLQQQLDQKAIDLASEEIVLPDIASEYSDSDDSDRETAFQRPDWAESPQLRAALEQQAQIDPDDLFGPIQPLSMEELFKTRNPKFRARTSSANWSGADRLTEAEEREYARRMGFRPLNAPRDGGRRSGDK